MYNLDYNNSSSWSVWDTTICEKCSPGVNVVMVGSGIRHLLEWCNENEIHPLYLSEAAQICLQLEYDYPLSEKVTQILKNSGIPIPLH